MSFCKKFFKEESGQAIILFALVFVVLCSFAALALDLGGAYIEKSSLQTAADAAALAGAQDLPDAAAASNTAIYYAGQNDAAAVTTATAPYNGDSNMIEVVCTKTITYTFARLLGFSDTTVSARAVAKKEQPLGGAFDYTLFSGHPSAALSITGSGQYVSGNAHSNYKFSITGSNQTINGSADAVSTFRITGSDIDISGVCRGSSVTTTGSGIDIGTIINSPAPFVDMPDFSEAIRLQAEACGQVLCWKQNLCWRRHKRRYADLCGRQRDNKRQFFFGKRFYTGDGRHQFYGKRLELQL